MAEFGAGGAGLRDEDRRALKEGKKLLKKALGAAGVLKGGRHKEKLRREKERRRDEQRARAQAEAREMAALRAELHQRATAAASCASARVVSAYARRGGVELPAVRREPWLASRSQFVGSGSHALGYGAAFGRSTGRLLVSYRPLAPGP